MDNLKLNEKKEDFSITHITVFYNHDTYLNEKFVL